MFQFAYTEVSQKPYICVTVSSQAYNFLPMPCYSCLVFVILQDFNCNIWLNNYIGNIFNCKINRSTDENLIGENCNETSCITYKVTKETVLQQVLQESPDQVNKLIDAIYAMSYGLNSTISSMRSGNETCKPSVCKNSKALVENYNKLRKTDRKE